MSQVESTYRPRISGRLQYIRQVVRRCRCNERGRVTVLLTGLLSTHNTVEDAFGQCVSVSRGTPSIRLESVHIRVSLSVNVQGCLATAVRSIGHTSLHESGYTASATPGGLHESQYSI